MLTIHKPVFKPDISFDVKLDQLEERQTIVHCNIFDFSMIRIWPTTYLIQEDGIRKSLIQAYNISQYPEWKEIFGEHWFTLVFEGLDRDCKIFDLLEDIPEPGKFHSKNIKRNELDVYFVEF